LQLATNEAAKLKINSNTVTLFIFQFRQMSINIRSYAVEAKV
jgi:hypothetical protein